jgi:hypothetical protein
MLETKQTFHKLCSEGISFTYSTYFLLEACLETPQEFGEDGARPALPNLLPIFFHVIVVFSL